MKPNQWYNIRAAQGEGEPAELYLFGEIGGFGITADNLRRDLAAVNANEIRVLINSGGGDVFEGLAVANLLTRHPARIITEVVGIAASMASYIFAMGDDRLMPSNAYLMIHNPTGNVYGESEDMRRVADIVDRLRDTLVKGYVQATGLGEAVIKSMMAKETYMTGDEALAQGFATGVLDEVKVAASLKEISLNRLFNIPKGLKSQIAQAETPEPKQEDQREYNTFTMEIIDQLNAAFGDQPSLLGQAVQLAAKDKALTAPEVINRIRTAATIAAKDSEIETLKADLAKASGQLQEAQEKAQKFDDLQRTGAGIVNTGARTDGGAGTPTEQDILAQYCAMQPGSDRKAFYQKHESVMKANGL